MPKINWNEIEISNDLILKENESIKIAFLDNGNQEAYEITDKQTNEKKTITKYSFKVLNLNDNSEKDFSTLASGLMNLLKPLIPLKDKRMIISKIRTGLTDFDIIFKVQIIE